MFRLDRVIKYIWRRLTTGLLWWLIPGVLFVLAVRMPWLSVTIPYQQASPQEVIKKLVEHRFSMELDFVGELDRGELSTRLREQFEKHGTTLSPQASLEVEQAGSEWTIIDDGTKYFVRNEDQMLKVYVSWLDGTIPSDQADQAVTAFYVKEFWWEIQIPYAKVTELPVKVSWSDIQIPVLWETISAAWLVALALLAILWAARRVAVWRLATSFVQALYNVPSRAEAGKFLNYSISGARFGFGPYLGIKEGKVAFGHDIAKQVGGPGGLVIYNDSAVVLEQAGKLTRVIRGPGFPDTIQPFEKVWEVVDLRPQRWPFPIEARTYDGIPVTYTAEVTFKVGGTDDDVFKAATDTWIREANRTEPDRLMTWPRRVIISWTEGQGRSLLARYTLDQLVDVNCREEIRAALEDGLRESGKKAGIEIRNVTLGDIKLDGQVLDQWFEAWRTERESELSKVIREGRLQRKKTVEGAKAEVRRDLLTQVLKKFNALKLETDQDQNALSRAMIWSLIEVLGQDSLGNSLYLSTILDAMKKLRSNIEQPALASGQDPDDGDAQGARNQGTPQLPEPTAGRPSEIVEIGLSE
ncbi:MAG: SPFH domain-containing protein [Thermoflexales bacterium]|nr:SPFH domain-containing protein [Thermoflexales bacterium]